MTTVVVASGQLVESVCSRLEEWSSTRYIKPSVWVVNTESARESFIIKDGERIVSEIGEALANLTEDVEIVALGLPDADGRIRFVASELENVIAEIESATPGRALAPPALIAVPDSDETRVELPELRLVVGSTTVVVPEDLPAPYAGNLFNGKDDDRFSAHAAHAFACLAGNWGIHSGDRSFLRESQDTTAPAAGRPIELVRCHSRFVDAGYLPAHIIVAAVRYGGGGWPNPDQRLYERGDLTAEVSDRLADAFMSAHKEILGLSELQPLPRASRTRLPLWMAIKRLVAYVIDFIKRRPIEWADERLGQVFDAWAGRVEALAERVAPGAEILVVRWRDRGTEPVDTFVARYLDATPLELAEGAVRPAWADLGSLITSLIDGAELPTWVDSRMLRSGGRRLLETRSRHLAPDPSERPPIRRRWEGAVCDPRSLGPILDGEIDELTRLLDQAEPDSNESKEGPDALNGAPVGDQAEDDPLDPSRSEWEQALAMLKKWREERVNTLAWKIGQRLATLLEEAEKTARSSPQNGWADVERAVPAIAKRERRRRFALLWYSLFGAGAIAAAALTHLANEIRLLVIVFIVVGWWLLLIRNLWRALVRPLREEREALEAAEKFLDDMALALLRRNDVKRLERRYREYLDWSEVIGHLVHRPWMARTRHAVVESGNYSLDLEHLPAACVVSYAVSDSDEVRTLVSRTRKRIFIPAWLTSHMEAVLEQLTLAWLRDNGLEPQEEARHDPRSDVSNDPEGLRISIVRAVRIGAHRFLDEVNEIRDAVGLLGQESLSLTMPRVIEGDSDAEPPLPPPAEWYESPHDLARLADNVREAVVYIEGDGQWRGSGVIVSERGLIATCRHCVEGRSSFHVVTQDGERHKAELRVIAPGADLALLQVDASRVFKSAAIGRSQDLVQGDRVFNLGHEYFGPGTGGPTLSWGIVTAPTRQMLSPIGLSELLLQTNFPAGPGASGSPVFNLSCEVIGIHTGGRSDLQEEGTRALHISLSVPSSVLSELIEGNVSPNEAPLQGPRPSEARDESTLTPWSFLSPLLDRSTVSRLGSYGTMSAASREVAQSQFAPRRLSLITAEDELSRLQTAQATGPLALTAPLRLGITRIDQSRTFIASKSGGDLPWFATDPVVGPPGDAPDTRKTRPEPVDTGNV